MLRALLAVTSAAFTSFIAFTMLYALIITAVGGRGRSVDNAPPLKEFPEVAILIAVKDEYLALRESLRRLTSVNYPLNRLKVYVGIDEGCVKCLDVCREFSPQVTAVFVSSEGKPAVLNQLFRFINSDYMLLMDCDSLISPNSLSMLLGAIADEGVCGATGLPRPSNPCMGNLPKYFLIESELWWRLMLGKDRLNLIVQAPGYFSLLKRSCVEFLGGWDEGALAEDNDLTLRIYASGSRVRLVNAEVLIESPTRLLELIKQRIRWYKGTLDVLRVRWSLIRRMSGKLMLDSIITYASPISPAILLILIIINTILGDLYNIITLSLLIPQIAAPLVVGRGLGLSTRVKLALLAVPYVLINSVASLIAITALLFGVRVRWWRTEKCGCVGVCDD